MGLKYEPASEPQMASFIKDHDFVNEFLFAAPTPATWNPKPSPFFFTLVTGLRRSLSLELSDTRVYEPQIRRAHPRHVPPETPTPISLRQS